MIEAPTTALYLSLFAVTTYTGVSAYMRLISNYSGVMAAVVTTSRKLVTIALSFLFFPKGANWWHVMSGIVVLMGFIFNDVARRVERRQMKALLKNALEQN
uniref:Sugar phosphate transporter domain-containing protein n=1 Tax=Tetraselmis sp. GSL018 TaxID=582737 RepID=A0A061SHA8_9CHLO